LRRKSENIGNKSQIEENKLQFINVTQPLKSKVSNKGKFMYYIMKFRNSQFNIW